MVSPVSIIHTLHVSKLSQSTFLKHQTHWFQSIVLNSAFFFLSFKVKPTHKPLLSPSKILIQTRQLLEWSCRIKVIINIIIVIKIIQTFVRCTESVANRSSQSTGGGTGQIRINYVRRYVFRWRLNLSVVGESLMSWLRMKYNSATDQDFTPSTMSSSDAVVRLDGLAAPVTPSGTVTFNPVVCHRLRHHTHTHTHCVGDRTFATTHKSGTACHLISDCGLEVGQYCHCWHQNILTYLLTYVVLIYPLVPASFTLPKWSCSPKPIFSRKTFTNTSFNAARPALVLDEGNVLKNLLLKGKLKMWKTSTICIQHSATFGIIWYDWFAKVNINGVFLMYLSQNLMFWVHLRPLVKLKESAISPIMTDITSLRFKICNKQLQEIK